MKHILCAIALASATFAAQAAPIKIDTLSNTSFDYADGERDQSYSVTNPAGDTAQGWASDSLDSKLPSPWLSNGGMSAWVTPTRFAASDVAAGTYIWKTTFDLGGLDPATAYFTGRFAADNRAAAYLNNALIGNATSFDAWSEFSSGTGNFVAGINTITFNVVNDGGPSGLRVEFLESGEAVAAVPEPETYALMLAGLGALGFVARRRKAA